MRTTRITVLALMAAIAVLALVGAASASATILCTNSGTQGSPCPSGQTPYTGSFSANGSIKIAWNSGVIECSEASQSGSISNSGGIGKNALGELTSATLSKCTDPYCNAAVATEATGLWWDIDFRSTSGNDGMMRTMGSVGYRFTFCSGTIFKFFCSYTIPSDEHTVHGGEGAELVLSSMGGVKSGGGALCPQTVSFSGKYTVTQPSSLYVHAY